MRRRRTPVAVAVAGAAALVAWCGWVSGFHRTSGAAEISWIISTGAVVAVDVVLWRRRARVRPEHVAEPWPRAGQGGGRHALVGVAPWLVLIMLALTWDVLGIDSGPHQYHLTISALAQAYRPLNAAVLLAWMFVGVGYEVARLRRPVTPAHGSGGTTGQTLAAGVVGLAHPPGVAAPALLLPQSPPIGMTFWIAVPVAAVAIDLAARRSDGRLADAGEFVRFVSSTPWANVLLMVAWLAAGYHLFAR